MTKECLWYNGETACYELLDFNPDGLSKSQIKAKAKKTLKEQYGFDKEDMKKVMETIYLIDIDNLEELE